MEGQSSPQNEGQTSPESEESIPESSSQKSLTESAVAAPDGSSRPQPRSEAGSRSEPRSVSGSVASQVDQEWEITYEQFLASFLTEAPLVQHFEQKVELCDAIERFRNRRLYDRTQSVTEI